MASTASPPPALRRAREGRLIGGVAAGVAARAGLDRRLARLGFVALGLVGGAGLILYLIAWVVIPPEGEPAPDAASGPVTLVAVAALAIGGFAFLRGIGGVIPAAVFLIALGLAALWWRQVTIAERPPPEGRARGAGPTRGVELPYPGPPPARPVGAVPPLAAPGRRGPPVTLATLSAALVVLVVVGVTGLFSPSPAGLLALALLIVGAGLVAGAWLGRSGPLIPLGIIIAVVLAPVAAGVPGLSGGTGERDWRPVSAAEATQGFDLGAGQGRLDLTDLRLPAGATRIDASVGFGHLVVTVPPGMRADVRAEAGAGEILVVDLAEPGQERRDSGFGVEVREAIGPAQARSRVVLELSVGFGAIEVNPR